MTPILRRINPELKGQIRLLFIVLSDDLFRQILRQFDKKKHESAAPATTAPSGSGSSSGPVTDESPPRAPDPSSKSSRSKSTKRGPSSDLSRQSKK